MYPSVIDDAKEIIRRRDKLASRLFRTWGKCSASRCWSAPCITPAPAPSAPAASHLSLGPQCQLSRGQDAPAQSSFRTKFLKYARLWSIIARVKETLEAINELNQQLLRMDRDRVQARGIAKHDRRSPPTTQLRRRLDRRRSRRSVGAVDAAGGPGAGRRCLAPA